MSRSESNLPWGAIGSFLSKPWLAALLPGLWFLTLVPVFSDPYLSEILARNDTQSRDDLGERSDWIELFNPDTEDVDLTGWALSDDPDNLRKWVFPATTLPAKKYRVVFASGQDRRLPGAPLHTNFQLTSRGEYLALSDPEGRIVSSFAPAFPPQHPDISYGLGPYADQPVYLIPAGAPAKALIPSEADQAAGWQGISHDDSHWLAGESGIGYGFSDRIGLNTTQMRGVNAGVYVRMTFELDDADQFERLILLLNFKDGFSAWLNGRKIASDNAPSSLRWNSTATESRTTDEANQLQRFEITRYLTSLRRGKNTLALQGFNHDIDSHDFLLEPRLVAYSDDSAPGIGYMYLVSRGERNRSAVPEVLEAPSISPASRTFQTRFRLTVSLPDSAPAGSAIRYTLDGSAPHRLSLRYDRPLTIDQTVRLRARVLGPNGGASPLVSETYVQLHQQTTGFSSNLPLIVLENFRGGRPAQTEFQPGFMALFEPGADGRATLLEAPALTVPVGLKVRGSSTAGRPKPSLSLEARNEWEEGLGITPLGLPRDPDWVLWGPYNFDLTLMHNPFAYELSNRIGRYAPRTRFVEVFFNTNGGSIRSSDYYGVYALIEKIKRDDDRVQLDRLFPEHDREPGVSGGYLLKIDRADPGDSGFHGGGQTLRYVEPKEFEMEQIERREQRNFLRTFFSQMQRSLASRYFQDPERNYSRYIDVDAAIDHHLLNVLTFNVDAFRLSGYLSLPRNGKLTFGPIWDFDRALGSTDGRDFRPDVWRSSGGTDFFNYPWWNQMFRDLEFFQRYIDRYQSLRSSHFDESTLDGMIDSMARQLAEAQERNLQRWRQLPRSRYGGTWQGEVNHMKEWLAARLAFMDRQFVSPPTLETAAGTVPLGTQVVLSSTGRGTVYYTTDGSDPRTPGGEPAPNALSYTEPLILEDNLRITARTRNTRHRSLTGSGNPPLTSYWSSSVSGRFVIDPPRYTGELLISEIHYHPQPPTAGELAGRPNLQAEDFEFLELFNSTERPVALAGVQLSGGISCVVPNDSPAVLEPGKTAVLAADPDAFRLRFGEISGPLVSFDGELSDDEAEILLTDSQGRFSTVASYRASWHPATDGHGFSLNPTPVAEPVADRPEAWTAASTTPGVLARPAAFPHPVRISEILNNSEPPQLDTIELYNPGPLTVGLGGWYLTDDRQEPRKYRIPDDLRIEPRQYLLLDETHFGRSPDENGSFRLSSRGEEVYLFAAEEARLNGYAHGFLFEAALPGQTQGLWTTSDGRQHLVQFRTPTPERPNSPPLAGPLVITEIFVPSTPESGGFVELRNLSPATLSLGGGEGQGTGWRIRGDVRFDFPEGSVLEPGARILVVPFDPRTESQRLDSFRQQWNITTEIAVSGPAQFPSGLALNSLKLQQPLAEFSDEETLLQTRDAVETTPEWPIPVRNEQSRQRLDEEGFGSDPAHWTVTVPTPGKAAADPRPEIVQITTEPDGIRLEIKFSLAGEYTVEYRGDLLTGDAWTALATLAVKDSRETISVQDQTVLKDQRFYRVVALP